MVKYFVSLFISCSLSCDSIDPYRQLFTDLVSKSTNEGQETENGIHLATIRRSDPLCLSVQRRCSVSGRLTPTAVFICRHQLLSANSNLAIVPSTVRFIDASQRTVRQRWASARSSGSSSNIQFIVIARTSASANNRGAIARWWIRSIVGHDAPSCCLRRQSRVSTTSGQCCRFQ